MPVEGLRDALTTGFPGVPGAERIVAGESDRPGIPAIVGAVQGVLELPVTRTVQRTVEFGAVLAEAEHTVVVEGNHYFPPEALHQEYFTDSETTPVCSWKGEARYYTVTVDGRSNPDAAWYYPIPLPEASEIKDHVALRHGVVVEDR